MAIHTFHEACLESMTYQLHWVSKSCSIMREAENVCSVRILFTVRTITFLFSNYSSKLKCS